MTTAAHYGSAPAIVPNVDGAGRRMQGHASQSVLRLYDRSATLAAMRASFGRAARRRERARTGRRPVLSTRAALCGLAVSLCALAAGGGAVPAPLEAALRGGGYTAPPSARSGPEQAMFAFLTAGSWCEESCFDTTSGPFGSCGVVKFMANGTFAWTVESDVSEVRAHGAWDLTLENATRGRIRIGGEKEYLFERRGEALWLAGERLRRCRNEAPASPPGSIAVLRPVARPALLDSLCSHDWIKEDDFNLYHYPLELHLDRDLRFVTRYRETSCRQSGRFSVDGRRLVFELESPACGDVRGGAGGFSKGTYDVAIVGSALALNGVRYVPLGSPRSRKRSPALCGNGSLCIDLTYDGEFRHRRETLLRLRFWNNAGRPVQLHSLRVSLRPYEAGKRGLEGSELEYPVAERTYRSGPLAPEASLSDSIRFTPPVRGDVMALAFEWDYEDASGVHHCSASPMVRIR